MNFSCKFYKDGKCTDPSMDFSSTYPDQRCVLIPMHKCSYKKALLASNKVQYPNSICRECRNSGGLVLDRDYCGSDPACCFRPDLNFLKKTLLFRYLCWSYSAEWASISILFFGLMFAFAIIFQIAFPLKGVVLLAVPCTLLIFTLLLAVEFFLEGSALDAKVRFYVQSHTSEELNYSPVKEFLYWLAFLAIEEALVFSYMKGLFHG